MKKVLAVALSMVMLLSLAVCSGASAADMTWCGWSGEEASTKPVIEGMISSWNAAHTDSPVSWTGWPWAETLQQLIIRNDGSEKIDIAQVDSSMFPTLVAADALVDMNTVFDPAWITDNIPEAGLNFGRKDGVQYGLPWTVASIGMLYNPTLLASVGYNEPPKTIAEFEDCLRKLHEKDKDLIPYALSTKDATATADFMPWLWAYGGSVFTDGALSIDSEAAVTALTWYKKLADEGLIKANMSRFDARQLFAQGKVAFYDDAIMARGIAQSNGVAPEDLDKTIQPMLRPVLKEGDKPTSTMWGHLLVMFKKSANQPQAAEFIQHVLSDEQALNYFDVAGMLPVLKSGLASDKVTSNAWANKWSEITETGRDNELKFHPQNAELTTIISEEVQAVIVSQKTPVDAAAAMKTRMESAL